METTIAPGIRSPLQLAGWNRFIKDKWELEACNCPNGGTGSEPDIIGQWWVDRRGRIAQPPTVPFTPLFPVAPHAAKSDRTWIDCARAIARDMYSAGTRSTISFPPELLDVRPWQWEGFLATVAYTSRVSLPHDLSFARHSVRKQIAKAERAGYRAEPARALDDVIYCLNGTEQKQQFQYGLTREDLRSALEYLGPEHLRTYVCYSASQEPASARVVLFVPNTWTIDWIAGTSADHRTTGATQFLIWHVLRDLADAGAIGFDFGGANLPNVARAKLDWGGDLVPFYRVRRHDLRHLLQAVVHWIRPRRIS